MTSVPRILRVFVALFAVAACTTSDQLAPKGKYYSKDDEGIVVFREDGVFGYKFAVKFDFYNADHLPSDQGRFHLDSTGGLELEFSQKEKWEFRIEWHQRDDSFDLIRTEKNGTLPMRAHYVRDTDQHGIEPSKEHDQKKGHQTTTTNDLHAD